MTVTLDLTPELESRILAEAALHGQDLTSFLLDLVRKQLQQPGHSTHNNSWEAQLENIGTPGPYISHDRQGREFLYED